MLTIGSLCTGIGGLDLAVEHHFDANLLWYSDIDPKANEVMAVHRPLAWALGDFTEVVPPSRCPTSSPQGSPARACRSLAAMKGPPVRSGCSTTSSRSSRDSPPDPPGWS